MLLRRDNKGNRGYYFSAFLANSLASDLQDVAIFSHHLV
jgi:hypothetical protein